MTGERNLMRVPTETLLLMSKIPLNYHLYKAKNEQERLRGDAHQVAFARH